MAHVNWKTKPITLNMSSHHTYQSQLELGVTPELALELHADLSRTFAPGGTELRLDLPENWTLYWKQKQGLSRLQLAHPQTDHWVATVHLTDSHATRFLEALRDLSTAGGQFSVTSLGAMAPIVNFELVVSLVKIS